MAQHSEQSLLSYRTAPLEHKEIKVAAVQFYSAPFEHSGARDGVKRNLDHLLEMCDKARGHQLIAFPEFSLTRGRPGFCRRWSRREWLDIAIQVPGPETEAIGKKAKEIGAYIEFASYTKEPDWPGHFFNSTVIVAPTGKVIHNHWKPYLGYPGIGIEYATTVFDVMTEFIKRYGWEAVWPVARTGIGNLSTYICSEGMYQEPARFFALNGAEILVRSFGGGGAGAQKGKFITQFRGDCAYNDCWGVYSNTASLEPEVPEASATGSSMIVGPWGQVIAIAGSTREEIVSATIPIAEFRTPDNRFSIGPRNPHMNPADFVGGFRTELYVPMFQQFPGQFPPDLLTFYQKSHDGELPPDFPAARKWYFQHARRDIKFNDVPEGPTD